MSVVRCLKNSNLKWIPLFRYLKNEWKFQKHLNVEIVAWSNFSRCEITDLLLSHYQTKNRIGFAWFHTCFNLKRIFKVDDNNSDGNNDDGDDDDDDDDTNYNDVTTNALKFFCVVVASRGRSSLSSRRCHRWMSRRNAILLSWAVSIRINILPNTSSKQLIVDCQWKDKSIKASESSKQILCSKNVGCWHFEKLN